MTTASASSRALAALSLASLNTWGGGLEGGGHGFDELHGTQPSPAQPPVPGDIRTRLQRNAPGMLLP